MIRHLIVGGIAVPLRGGVQITQVYTPREQAAEHVMADNSLRKQTLGGIKYDTRLTGRGIVPPGLHSIAYNAPFVLSGIAPLDVISASPNIPIPPERRTDPGSTPIGRAYIGERIVRTPVTMNGDTAELTPVGGADFYQVLYFPEFLALSGGPVLTHDKGRGYDWTLNARQV